MVEGQGSSWNYLCHIGASVEAVVGAGRDRWPVLTWTRLTLGFVRGGGGVGGIHGVA